MILVRSKECLAGDCANSIPAEKRRDSKYCSGSCRARESSRRWRTNNPEKARFAQTIWRHRNPEKSATHNATTRMRKGYPWPTRPKPGCCECCGDEPTNVGLALDHDHATNEFRGWLCFRCNTGIGHLGDNIDGLKRALKYLKENI